MPRRRLRARRAGRPEHPPNFRARRRSWLPRTRGGIAGGVVRPIESRRRHRRRRGPARGEPRTTEKLRPVRLAHRRRRDHLATPSGRRRQRGAPAGPDGRRSRRGGAASRRPRAVVPRLRRLRREHRRTCARRRGRRGIPAPAGRLTANHPFLRGTFRFTEWVDRSRAGVAMPELLPLAVVFLAGAVVGSFLNKCIERLPFEKSLIWPGSRCRHCCQPIAWRDSIPLVSYWLCRGRCRSCGRPFSVRYFAIELLTAGSFVALYYLEVVENIHDLNVPNFLRAAHTVFAWHALLFCFLLVATFVDIDHYIIPLPLTIAGTLVGLVGSMVW